MSTNKAGQGLNGRWALVTGASSGLGVDFARELASRGCNLVLVARRQDRLAALRAELERDLGVAVRAFPVDLLTPNAAQTLHTALVGEGIAVDLLINNAGRGTFGNLLDGTWENDRDTIALNIGALVELTRLFGKDMAARGFGRILQVASTGAYQPAPSLACYGATKAFVLSYGEALGREWLGTGVTCTVLSPGFTATEFFQSSGQPIGWLARLVMMDSKVVARIGVRALLAGKRAVIAGWGNAVLAWAERFVPRRMVTAIAHFILDPKNARRR